MLKRRGTLPVKLSVRLTSNGHVTVALTRRITIRRGRS